MLLAACQSPPPKDDVQESDIVTIDRRNPEIHLSDATLVEVSVHDVRIAESASLEATPVDTSPVDLPPLT